MSKIKVTMLGTTAAVPTRERGHPAVHVSFNDGQKTCFLFDCGEGTQRQLIKARLSMMKIEKVFITHWHGDHSLGLPGMVDTMGFEGRKTPLEIYAPEARKIKKILNFSHSFGGFKVFSRDVCRKGKKVSEEVSASSFKILSIPVKHSVPAVAYAFQENDKVCIDPEKAAKYGLPEKSRIYRKLKDKGALTVKGRRIKLEDIAVVKKGKKIVYSGDTEICDNLRKLASGADLLIQDCTYFDSPDPGKNYQHAALPEIIEMVSNEHIKKTILTHISRRYKNLEWMKNLIKNYPGFEIAEDFMEIDV